MKKKMTAIAMCICILAGMITGCNASDQKKTEARTKKEITIAVNSETGGMDPAGNIALTYLSYLVTRYVPSGISTRLFLGHDMIAA